MRDYYQVLGISRDASSTDVRAAFRRLSLELHPDRTQDDPERTEEYKNVMEAYEVLSNEEVRAAYDDALAGRATGPPAITAQAIFEGLGSMAGLFMEAVARANPDKVEIGTCIVCKGLGELAIDLGVIHLSKRCEACGGSGKITLPALSTKERET